jgi:UDP-glucuronate decarboxylase
MNTENRFTGPINLGNPNEFSMKELAELTLKLIGGKSMLSYRPLPIDDPKQRQPDIALAKSKLAWEPKVQLEDGLKETISYFRRRLST